jgi:type II secretory pathway pseudopilin PulG
MTLIEVAVATVIIGIGIAAILVASASTTHVNEAGRKLTLAVFLAQEIREWTLRLPFSDPDPGDQGNPPGPDNSDPQVFVDDLDDLMDVTYSPPRDGQGTPISDMVGWSQKIYLTWRNPDNLTQVVTAGSSDIVNVQVEVSYKGQQIMSTSWLIARRSEQ